MQVAPNQISPGEPFDVFYFLRNPLDSTTYYVRAKIYDVRTGALLDTISLDQSGANARLFIKTVQAPADPSGYGRNIVAVASVYTDAGFTSQSESYEEQEQYFLIRTITSALGGGGIDFRGLREMIEEALDKRFDALLPPTPAEFPSEALFGAIGALQREVNRIPKEAQSTELLSAALARIEKAIKNLPPPPKETDLGALTEGVNSALFEIEQLKGFIKQVATAITSADERVIREIGTMLLGQIEGGLKDLMGRQELTIPLHSLLREKKPEPSSADVKHIM